MDRRTGERSGARREIKAPMLINLVMDASTVKALDRKAAALSKKHGFQVSRSAIIREICENYINVTGG